MARNRLQIDISAVILRKLILSAANNGEKRNTWARIVLTRYCQDTQNEVDTWLKNEADRLGVPHQELENSILAREGFDFEQYRSELLGDENDPND